MLQIRRPSPAVHASPRSPALTPAHWLLVGAFVLIATALAWRELALFNPDDPPRALVARDAELAGGALLRHETSAWQIIARYHDAGERLWKTAWLSLNGQLDPRVSSLTTLALQGGAFALVLAALMRALRLRWAAAIGLALIAALFAPMMANVRPPAGSAGASGAVLWSLLHVLLMFSARPNSVRWWIGCALGGVNVLWSTAGIASAGALTLWAARIKNRPLLTANSLLLAAGAGLMFSRANPGASAEFFSSPWLALLICAPAVVCGWNWLRRPVSEQHSLTALLALWATGQLAVSIFTGTDRGESLLIALAVNLACVIALRPVASRHVVFAGLWLIVIGDALIHTASPGIADAAAANTLLNRPELRGVLPMSLRPPLAIGSGNDGFAADRAPELPGRGDLPVIGTWTAQDGGRAGEFVSAPLRSTFPFMQLRVAGTLRPPATSLVLRTPDGKEIAPLEPAFTATERWKRVNFAAPGEPFQIVARDHSPTDWLAFTAPVEVGRWTRVAGKIPGLWPALLGGGLLFAAAGFARLRWASASPPTPIATGDGSDQLDTAAIAKVAPWLGLFAYLLFFSHHVDVTAGPNDSGGYLNSAKLIASGALTAAPRIPAGIEIDPDTTLYVPITFHANGNRVVPEYPVGFPLEVAAMAQIFPFERGLYLLMLLQLGLGVVFTQKLARAFGLGAGWAWLAGGIIGLSPVYLFQALQPQSDGPSLLWVTAAVYWAWTSREKPARAIFAGLATALAVLLRPSNVLCVFPVLVCLAGPFDGFRIRPGGLRRVLQWALAGLPPGVWLLWYQHTLYGSWHTTGYGDISTGFGLRFLEPTLKSYAIWLPEMFTPLVCLALAGPFLRSVEVRARVVLTLWAGLFVAFYSVYWCTWDNWYNMRFVLPAAPAMLVMALLVAREILRALERRAPALALRCRKPAGFAVAAVLLAFLARRSADRDVTYWLHNNHEHAYAARWVRDHLPANAVVFAKHATGSLFHYTDLPFIRSDHEKVRGSTQIFDQLERAGRPIYALNYHWETAGYVWGRGRGSGYPDLPGSWERVALMWDDDVMVWKRLPSAAAPTR